MGSQTQQTPTNVMDAIITQHDNGAVFQKFGNEYDNSVLIISDQTTKRTSLYVNLKKVGNSIDNITWAQLEKLQQEAFEAWLAIQN